MVTDALKGNLKLGSNHTMEINVKAHMGNLSYPIRNTMELIGVSHLLVLNACNAYLGKLVGKQTGDDKRSDGKVNTKKESFKMSVQPGRVEFKGTYDSTTNIVALFIAWNDAVEKCHKLANMESVSIPTVFEVWLQFAKKQTEQPVTAK